MPKGIKNKNTENLLDNLKETEFNINSIDSTTSSLSASAKPETLKTKSPQSKNDSLDLKKKYPSRTLEELRKIDFLHQYESKFPKIERPGYKIAWICNTPFKDNISFYYSQGYELIEDAPTVVSGYTDLTGEDKFAYHAMMIPIELYEKRQKALKDLNNKMYGHILNPDTKGKYIEGDGMYEPKGRQVRTITKVLTPSD